ncbi:hypothetical protein T484DRAFT_1791538 [Baffinella frigidus]|nr:hypothetical protein T484DRAFT_1791538 [Cryptophyta sp. CCMP2293]
MSTAETASESSGVSNLVHCEFDSYFNAPIETTLDQYLFHFIKDLANRYKASGVQANLSATSDEGGAVSPALSKASYSTSISRALAGGAVSPALSKASYSTSISRALAGGAVSPALSKASYSTSISRALAGGSRRRRDYKCLFFVLEPQISHLNETSG